MENSPFAVRGAIEGFYGTFYTFPERNDLIRFLGEHGFNFYMYCPKNDRQHRAQWRVPYTAGVLDDFAETIWIARDVGVTFCYAISFGVPVRFGSAEDMDIVVAKLHSFYGRGCRAFAVLFDDITESWITEMDGTRFRSAAHGHSYFCNRIYDWAQALPEPCSLYLCQPEYCGRPPFSPYLEELGRELDPGIEVFYTGQDVCSRSIDREDVRAFGEAIHRKPLLWDNYPVNDLKMRADMHIGPLQGRDERLWEAASGLCANLMAEAEASKVPLLTIAEYLSRPEGYDPEAAWHRALLEVGGVESYPALSCFAENALRSPLRRDGAPRMTRLGHDALAAVRIGGTGDCPEVDEFARYLDALDEATYYLKTRMRNLALRQNLLPWIEALDDMLWLGRGALRIVKALDSGADPSGAVTFTRDLLTEVREGRKRIGGTAAVELAEEALELADRHGRELQSGSPLPAWPHGLGAIAVWENAPMTNDHTGLQSAAG